MRMEVDKSGESCVTKSITGYRKKDLFKRRFYMNVAYTLFKRRGCVLEEQDEVKLQVLFCEGAHSNLRANTPIGDGL